MTRTLILIRHCKSDWDASAASDHDRPLNARGRRSAPRIGAFLAAQDLVPDLVLCSDARRTRETWAGIADALPEQPDVQFLSALYHAEPLTILRSLGPTSAERIAIVGHNPGIGALAWHLTEDPPADERFSQYPTGATTVLGFDDDTDWSRPSPGSLLHFVTPRDLPDP